MGLSLAALAAFAPNFVPGLYAEDAAAPAAAPAARAVRLSSVEGQVQLSVGNQAATAALANTPLFEGSQLTTADDGRAEIQFEDGSVARLSPNSSLTLTTLKMNGATPETEILVDSGLAYFEFSGSGKLRIRFGDAIATPTGSSVLRVNLDTPPGTLAVFSGEAHLERGPTVMIDLRGGESVALNAGDPSKYILAESIEPDSWDGWNSDRDQALSAEAASSTGAAGNLADNGGGMAGPPPEDQGPGDQAPGDQAANDTGGEDMAPNTPAWNDLDANGAWYNVPGTGYVWSPYAASGAGWDPYGCGQWQWTPRFGYIWVSCFNWGYLPYQFGAWNYYNGFGWCWAPGIGHRHPWWRGGVWVSTVRFGPPGYRIPMRPRGIAGRYGGPVPAIHVNRMAGAETAGLPLRARNTPIAIGGQTVMPLRPILRRPQYGGPVPRTANNPQPRAGYVGGRATVWPAHSGPFGTSGPAVGSYVAPSSGTGAPAGGTVHGTAPRSAPRVYSAPPRYSAPARSAPSGGGGHVSSGGGGGHASGGGTHR